MMNLFTTTIAAVAIACGTLIAQTNPRSLGGGCPGQVAPGVTGPFTIGAPLIIEPAGCNSTPGSSRFLLLGIELPQPNRLTLPLMTTFGTTTLCDLAINPIIAVGDFSNRSGPIMIQVPNDPFWRGFPLAIGAFCVECGIAGC